MDNQDKSMFKIKVNVKNPGQFFACCGITEVANRLYGDVCGWFEGDSFCCSNNNGNIYLSSVLDSIKNIKTKKNGKGEHIFIKEPFEMVLDWWLNDENKLKTWSGKMDEDVVLRSMCKAIDPANEDPFNQSQVVYKDKKKKCEPFYFDSRRGDNSNKIDVGFSTNNVKMESIAFPVVEALCFIGLQRNWPQNISKERKFEYCTWNYQLPVELIVLAVCGMLSQFKYQKYCFERVNRSGTKRAYGAFTSANFAS
jgi:hypothetical protein